MEVKRENQEYSSMEEARAYDSIAKAHGFRLHNPLINKLLELKKEGLLLDLGCGTGMPIAKILSRSNMRAVGLDISGNMLEIARDNIKKKGLEDKVEFVKGDMQELPSKFRDKKFDAVISLNAMHHIKDVEGVLEKIKNVTKQSGGIVVIEDLVKLPRILQDLCLHIFGLPYSKEMKKQYQESLKAAKSIKEWREIIEHSGLKGAKVYRIFPHYVMIVKEFTKGGK